MAKDGTQFYTKRVDDHPGGGPVMTKQDQRDSTDINLIIEAFRNTGQTPMSSRGVPKYGDFTMSTDLAENIQAVRDAEAQFMSLPPRVRELVGNDPVQFLEAMADEGGRKALEEAGLKIWEDPAPPAAPPVAPEPPVS